MDVVLDAEIKDCCDFLKFLQKNNLLLHEAEGSQQGRTQKKDCARAAFVRSGCPLGQNYCLVVVLRPWCSEKGREATILPLPFLL